MTSAPIHYQLDFKRYKQHLIDVTITLDAHVAAPTLWLPTWIPGSYLIREFARNITAVHYAVTQESNAANDTPIISSKNLAADTLQRAQKLSKNEWQLSDVKAGERVVVQYEVYCYDLSVRTAYVDQTRLYGNFTSLVLAIEGLEASPVQVSLNVPHAFYDGINTTKWYLNAQKVGIKQHRNKDNSHIKFVCGLSHNYLHIDGPQAQQIHQYNLQAPNYAELIDYPFELAAQAEFDFIIHDKHKQTLPHHFYISGQQSANMGRLQTDLTHICQTYLNWLGDAPFGAVGNNNYTFMTFASGNDYGGLEHINSTSLITPRNDLPTVNEADEPSDGYQRFLGLCSHEYFHAWWVKTVRPDVMLDVNLRQEAYTPLLWVFEGFTSYIDDFMLQASGVISKESYLKLLANQINRYTQTQGRHYQSVAESSFDAWIKLYRSDENTGNAGISYYNKGALVALCLDILMLKETKGKYRIFDVVKNFYQRAKQQDNRRIGMTTANLGEVVAEFIDEAVWLKFVDDYVNGIKELPLTELLEAQGIDLVTVEKDNTLPWGMTVSETPEGLKVSKVLRDSVASEAGLSAKDVIVAIEGIKASKKQLQIVAESNIDMVTCHAFRRDELMTFNVGNKTASGINSNPSLDKIELKLDETGYEAWLTPNF